MQRMCLTILFLLAVGVAHAADFVIAVSVDGMGSTYLQRMVDAGKLPHFRQIEVEGACTTNARTDYDITVTLPNHTTMLTSRPIKASGGHFWISNSDPAEGMTIHSNAGQYIASVFDVAREQGRRTGLWSTKTKFSIYASSYKMDVFHHEMTSEALAEHFISTMQTQPCHFAFVHFGTTDAAGHAYGWGSDAYNQQLTVVDGCLGRIMSLMTNSPALNGKATLIITADHGGKGQNHQDPTLPIDYTIPFLTWGAGVTAGDLYVLNNGTRLAPGTGRPDYAAKPQPIRDGDLGNLSLALLGLKPIPGSQINVHQDLRLQAGP